MVKRNTISTLHDSCAFGRVETVKPYADILPATRDCVEFCVEVYTVATNLSIDPKLIEDALKVSGERTKRAAVTKALQEYIARRRQKRLLELMGKLEWDSSYDYKAERRRD